MLLPRDAQWSVPPVAGGGAVVDHIDDLRQVFGLLEEAGASLKVPPLYAGGGVPRTCCPPAAHQLQREEHQGNTPSRLSKNTDTAQKLSGHLQYGQALHKGLCQVGKAP